MKETIAWDRIEAILRKDYPVGQKKEGNKAYTPLLLFKCFRLQKWFHLSSGPELEDSINNRESFQIFLGVSSVEVLPDDSTFSKFRKRLTKGKFNLIAGNIPHQSAAQGLTINEGVAIDARVVKSAGRPVSNKKIEDLKAKRESPEGKLDKNGQHYYGLKEQTSVDATHGFVLAAVLSKASVHETNYLAYSTIYSRQTKQKLAVVSGDKRAHDMPNRSFSAINNFKDGLMRKSETKAQLTELEIDRKQEISQARSIVEQYFGCKSSS